MFIEMLGERRARLLQQKEDIDAVLAEIDGVERECRRLNKKEARGRKLDAPRQRGRRTTGRAGLGRFRLTFT